MKCRTTYLFFLAYTVYFGLLYKVVTYNCCSLSEIEGQFREKVYYENIAVPFNYTKFDFLIRPLFNKSVYCPQVPVFYIIRSHPNKTDEREFIRSTWASSLKNSIVFVLGNAESVTVRRKVLEEANKYQDLLVIDMLDSYKNLSIKSIGILKWVTRFCNAPRFFFQGDPDVAVFTTSIAAVLNLKDNRKPRIYGYCWQAASVFRDRSSKWRMDYSVYSSITYPRYVAGAAWIFSPSVPAKILDALVVPRPYFHVDDVLISGILAERANIPRECIHSVGYPEKFYDITKCLNPPLMAIFQLSRPEIVRALNTVRQGIFQC